MDTTTLRPHRHDPPGGWGAEMFERVTDAMAAALVSAYRRQAEQVRAEERSA